MLAGLLVGFMISLFQAVTQIQEQTLTFVPKIIAVFVVILITGGCWVIGEIQLFTQETYDTVGAWFAVGTPWRCWRTSRSSTRPRVADAFGNLTGTEDPRRCCSSVARCSPACSAFMFVAPFFGGMNSR